MANDKSRAIATEVDIRRNYSSTVASHHLHGDPSASLQTPPYVTAVPGHPERYLWVYADRSKHRAGILHIRPLGCDKHCESRDANELKPHHKYASLSDLVCIPARCNCEKACANIWRDGHELRIVRGVAHILDDRWEKQGEGVYGTKARHAYQHEDVYLPVSDSLPDIFHIEIVGEMSMVRVKAPFDFSSFFGSQESCTVVCYGQLVAVQNKSKGYLRGRIVIDAPVCNYGDHNAQEAF